MADSKEPTGAGDEGLPLWAHLRKAYEFASPEERTKFDEMAKTVLEKADVEGQCVSGCQSSKTGGCKPGTSCLFSALQG